MESKVADLKVQNSKYEDEVIQLKAQLQAGHQKQADMQSQLIELMSQMAQSKERLKENEGEK